METFLIQNYFYKHINKTNKQTNKQINGTNFDLTTDS